MGGYKKYLFQAVKIIDSKVKKGLVEVIGNTFISIGFIRNYTG
jgi:hypothetical protein